MAADSLSVHSSTTLDLISFINNINAFSGFLMCTGFLPRRDDRAPSNERVPSNDRSVELRNGGRLMELMLRYDDWSASEWVDLRRRLRGADIN